MASSRTFSWADISAEEDDEINWQAGMSTASSKEDACGQGAQLNADAAIFIPTLTAMCSAIAVGPANTGCKELGSFVARRKAQPARLEIPAREIAGSKGSNTRFSPGVMPDVSEEQWCRRNETRLKAVSIAKSTREYQSYSRTTRYEDRTADDPTTPDPLQRSTSARMWKSEMQQWRSALSKKWGRSPHGSVVSTDDCTSDAVSSAFDEL